MAWQKPSKLGYLAGLIKSKSQSFNKVVPSEKQTGKPLSFSGGKSFRGSQNPFEKSNNNPFESNPNREYWIVKPKDEYAQPQKSESVVHRFGENQSPFIKIKDKRK